MKRFAILALLLLPFAAGCGSLCFWRKAATTQVAVLDENGEPATNVTVKGKLGGDYVMVPREYMESGATAPASTTTATAAKKKTATARPATRTTATQDDKHRISWDGAARIRTRCIQKFGKADVFPGRAGDWHTAKPDVTADGYLDPDIVGPIIEAARKRNQARLAANPNLREDQLEKVCFNFHSPTGERHPEHLTKDGGWAMVTPTSADPGGRVVLTGGVNIVSEIAAATEFGHEAGDRICAFAVIPY